MLNDAISYSELRANLKTYLDRVIDDCAPLLVKRKNGRNVVIIDADEFAKMDETEYLMSNPKTHARLTEAINRPREEFSTYNTIQELDRAIENRTTRRE